MPEFLTLLWLFVALPTRQDVSQPPHGAICRWSPVVASRRPPYLGNGGRSTSLPAPLDQSTVNRSPCSRTRSVFLRVERRKPRQTGTNFTFTIG